MSTDVTAAFDWGSLHERQRQRAIEMQLKSGTAPNAGRKKQIFKLKRTLIDAILIIYLTPLASRTPHCRR
jgi:hypothetical protein